MGLNKFLEILGFGASDNEKKKVVDKAEKTKKDAKKAVKEKKKKNANKAEKDCKGKKVKDANKAVKNDKEKKDKDKDKERKKIERVPIPDSSRETSQKVWDQVLISIEKNQYDPNAVGGKILEVYLHTANRPIFEQYQSELKDCLKQYLDVEGGYVVSKIVFAYGVPKNKTEYLQIEKYDVYYRFGDSNAGREVEEIPQPDPPEEDFKAIIRAIPGMGKMKEESFELSSAVLKGKKFYNIGRGVDVVKRTFRHNDIAIDENGGERERRVSRAHARIGYIKGSGFYLQAEDGCLQNNSRTRIMRGDKLIDLKNPLQTESLCDGDRIELAREVYILFELIN